MVNEIVN